MYNRNEEGPRPSTEPRKTRKEENRTTLESISNEPGGRKLIFVCPVSTTSPVVSTPGRWGNPVFGAWRGGRDLALISTFASFPWKMSGAVATAAVLTRGTRYSSRICWPRRSRTRHYQTTSCLPSSSQERGGGVATAKPYVVQQCEAWPAWRYVADQAWGQVWREPASRGGQEMRLL